MPILTAANTGNKITVIVLCIAVVVLMLVNVILVVSLHRNNNKLVRTKKLPVSEVEKNSETEEIIQTEGNTESTP